MVYTTEYASPLGPITLACDEDAIIGSWFNGQRYFGNILPEQTEQKEQPLFADAKRWLDVYFSGRAPDFMPPLRYNSTPFRKTVCEIMLTIPYGRTMTYGEIAAEIARQQGLEKMSAQAVGGAVGHNPISLMIPRCGHERQSHRLWRRHCAEGEAAGIGACGHARPVRAKKGHRALKWREAYDRFGCNSKDDRVLQGKLPRH